jgi:uncharacterized protein (DUF1778 family)
MGETRAKRYRLSIDVESAEHRKIKMCAAIREESVRSYVLEAIKGRLKTDLEQNGLLSMSNQADPVLSELWDNKKDSAYDNL